MKIAHDAQEDQPEKRNKEKLSYIEEVFGDRVHAFMSTERSKPDFEE